MWISHWKHEKGGKIQYEEVLTNRLELRIKAMHIESKLLSMY